ncbi:type IV conjugative transfer system lipoprotein TraV [Serratia marcescens]|uniref:type IV conjugative transfer system lipoprotein TraV n=1 Tax=Serratia marcescens TaxID=615 RepID=UPI0032047250
MKHTLSRTLLCSVVMLSGCAGMNSEFEFDKPAKDSGIWMSQADDMTLGHHQAGTSETNGMSAAGSSQRIDLAGYRLIDTGHIRLDVQPVVPGTRGAVPATSSMGEPVRTSAPASGGVFSTTTRSVGAVSVPGSSGTVSCNTPRCYPEPAAAFRKPDGVQRIWIAPYVSPDEVVHMGEIVFAVAKPADWNGVL